MTISKPSPAGTASCSGCGSVYKLTRHPLLSRDKDYLACNVCGEPYLRWNESACYTDELVSRGIAPPASVE